MRTNNALVNSKASDSTTASGFSWFRGSKGLIYDRSRSEPPIDAPLQFVDRGIDVVEREAGKICGVVFPPLDLIQSLDDRIRKAFADRLSRHSSDDRVGRYVLVYHRTGSADGPVPDVNAGANHDIRTNPHIIADHHGGVFRKKFSRYFWEMKR